jgi:hypothetical protein
LVTSRRALDLGDGVAHLRDHRVDRRNDLRDLVVAVDRGQRHVEIPVRHLEHRLLDLLQRRDHAARDHQHHSDAHPERRGQDRELRSQAPLRVGAQLGGMVLDGLKRNFGYVQQRSVLDNGQLRPFG